MPCGIGNPGMAADQVSDREIGAIPGHGPAEADHQHFRDAEHEPSQGWRSVVQADLEAEMVALAHADSGAEQDEPAHQQQGCRLRPARRLVEHIAAEDLPADEDGHQNEAHPGQPQAPP